MASIAMTPALTAAATLLEQQRFQEAVVAFEAIVRSDANNAALAAMQVGVAHFFLARYDLATQWYQHAGSQGWDPQEVAEHVQEAADAVATGSPPTPQGGVQHAFSDGQAWINIGGAGWEPYTHPRPGVTVLRDNGSIWVWGQDGRWTPTTTAEQPHPNPAPMPGEAVFDMSANEFFVLQPDGSWRPRPEPAG